MRRGRFLRVERHSSYRWLR